MAAKRNTLQKGGVRYIVFREGKTWYAVALEFNIVESGDDPREVLLLLFEAIQGYLTSARKAHARPSMLNQRTDREYEELWNQLHGEGRGRPSVRTPVYTFGERSLVPA